MRKGHPWDDLIFRALRHAWLFDAYVSIIPNFQYNNANDVLLLLFFNSLPIWFFDIPSLNLYFI